jgi:hypothetical protein
MKSVISAFLVIVVIIVTVTQLIKDNIALIIMLRLMKIVIVIAMINRLDEVNISETVSDGDVFNQSDFNRSSNSCFDNIVTNHN